MKWERRLWAVMRNISEKLRTPGTSAISRMNAECVTTGKRNTLCGQSRMLRAEIKRRATLSYH